MAEAHETRRLDAAADRPPETASKPAARNPLPPGTQVVAGGLAATVAAVAGSHLGTAGTILGAGIGSVITTVAASIIQRSIERGRGLVVAGTSLLRDRGSSGNARDAEPGTGPDEPGATTRLDAFTTALPVQDAEAATPRARPRPWWRSRQVWLWAASAAAMFAISMIVIFGIETAKGSSLSGTRGDSTIGQVFGNRGTAGGGGTGTTPSPQPTPAEPSPAQTPSARPTEGGSAGNPTSTPAPAPTTAPTARPTPSPSATRAPAPTVAPTAGSGFGTVAPTPAAQATQPAN